MSNQKRGWQETDYVLSVFGNAPAASRRSYAAYVKVGYGQGRRRNNSQSWWLGGIEKVAFKGPGLSQGRRADSGNRDFVTSILAEAN